MATANLTKKEIAAVRRELKPYKMPKVGWCKKLGDGREVCRDARGFFLVGEKR